MSKHWKIRVGLLCLLGGLFLSASSLQAQAPAPANLPPVVGPNSPAGNGGAARPGLGDSIHEGVLGQMGAIVGCSNTDPRENLGALVTFLICTLSRYASAIAVLILMFAGLLYVMSGANPALAGTAKAIVVTTITGLVAMYSISLVLGILVSSGVVSKGN